MPMSRKYLQTDVPNVFLVLPQLHTDEYGFGYQGDPPAVVHSIANERCDFYQVSRCRRTPVGERQCVFGRQPSTAINSAGLVV